MVSEPDDAAERRAVRPVEVYPPATLPPVDLDLYAHARKGATEADYVRVPPREARTMRVPAGSFLRIECPKGPQVGDLNLWASENLHERFFSGKTRALHGTHLSLGDRLWSAFPYLRPVATVTFDSLEWYGFDADGCGVHDVIGTRCDPYTHRLLSGGTYHHCCHSNLTRALAEATGLSVRDAEPHVHDVLNVFMCTGFDLKTHRYIMKASPVRAGDAIELFAEIDLLAALSACPGGDCGSTHSSDEAACHPLDMRVLTPERGALDGWRSPEPSGYDRTHGTDQG